MATKLPTRDRLLDAATVLIWRLGYNAVSVDTICEAAGANKGSFYHAFASKADLLVAAIARVWQADAHEIAAIYSGPGGWEDRLRRHLDWFVASQRRLLERHGFVPGHFNMALDVKVPEPALAAVRSHRAEHQEMLRIAVAGTLAERGVTGDADWLAMVIGHIIGGVMIEARLGDSLQPVEALPATVIGLLDRTCGERGFSSGEVA